MARDQNVRSMVVMKTTGTMDDGAMRMWRPVQMPKPIQHRRAKIFQAMELVRLLVVKVIHTYIQELNAFLTCFYCTVLSLSTLFELKWRRPSKTNPLIQQKPQKPQKPPNVSNGVKQVAANQMDLVNHIMTKNAGHW